MALAIGKRKRRQDLSNAQTADPNDSDDDAAARALFQRAFEKKFKPLEKDEKPAKAQESSSDDSPNDDDEDDFEDDELSGSDGEDDDFSGFSSDNSDTPHQATKPQKPQIEVIEDKTYQRPDRASEKRLKKEFMSSKVPQQQNQPTKTPATNSKDTDKDATAGADDDSTNLQNDLALQRLLKESHLLDPSTFSATGTASSAPEGAARLRALDMRMRDLGGKKSHLEQEKMPIAFRKGMVAKAGEREGKRRTEAKENGIILESEEGQADWDWRAGYWEVQWGDAEVE